MVLCRRNACLPRIEVWRQAQSITVYLQTADCVQVNKASLSLRYSLEPGHGQRGRSKSEPWRWSVLKPEASVGRAILVWCDRTCETESLPEQLNFINAEAWRWYMQEVRTWVHYTNQVCWLQMHAPRSLWSSVVGRCALGRCSSVVHKLICKVFGRGSAS